MSNENEYLNILNKAATDSAISWWPKYLYHYSNIDNVINILKDKKLYARNNAKNMMLNENASISIIDNTDDFIKNCVRFYFRPLTPTQYRNEGYHSKNNRYNSANVPVPIFLLFEASKILALPNVFYSETSLATRKHHLTKDINEFKNFDFKKIYSLGPYPDGKNFTPYRHAEVIIPDMIDLSYLKLICCRTKAEYETFCFLLKENGIYEEYKDKILIKESERILFYKNALYLSKVNLMSDNIMFIFTNLEEHRKVDVCITIDVFCGNEVFKSQLNAVNLTNKTRCVHFEEEFIKVIEQNKKYKVEVHFDDCLVYANEFLLEQDDMPF